MSERRGTASRVLLVASNILFPGMALVRVGRPGLGVALAVAPLLAVAGARLIPFLFSVYTFWSTMPILAGVTLLAIAAIAAAMVLTWSSSAIRRNPRGMSRWPVVIALSLALVALAGATGALPESYRLFYVSSESMLPALRVNDRIMVRLYGWAPLQRGDTVVLGVGSAEYVERIVGLPGDTVAMHGGLVVLNGKIVGQRPAGQGPSSDGMATTRLLERLAGEARPHAILDTGLSQGDDFAAVTVPPDQLFVLGDNRDRSADSRFGLGKSGVGMAAVSDVVGKVDFIYWSDDRHRIGVQVH